MAPGQRGRALPRDQRAHRGGPDRRHGRGRRADPRAGAGASSTSPRASSASTSSIARPSAQSEQTRRSPSARSRRGSRRFTSCQSVAGRRCVRRATTFSTSWRAWIHTPGATSWRSCGAGSQSSGSPARKRLERRRRRGIVAEGLEQRGEELLGRIRARVAHARGALVLHERGDEVQQRGARARAAGARLGERRHVVEPLVVERLERGEGLDGMPRLVARSHT